MALIIIKAVLYILNIHSLCSFIGGKTMSEKQELIMRPSREWMLANTPDLIYCNECRGGDCNNCFHDAAYRINLEMKGKLYRNVKCYAA